MGSHSVPWGPIASHGVPWGPMGSHGVPWGPARSHRAPPGYVGQGQSQKRPEKLRPDHNAKLQEQVQALREEVKNLKLSSKTADEAKKDCAELATGKAQ